MADAFNFSEVFFVKNSKKVEKNGAHHASRPSSLRAMWANLYLIKTSLQLKRNSKSIAV